MRDELKVFDGIEFIFMGNGFQENVIQIKKDDSKCIKLIKSSILQ